MKITENEVKVVKHQSVIAPLLLLLFFLFVTVGECVVIPSSTPANLLSTRRYGLKLTGCCLRLQKMPLRAKRGRMMEQRLTSSDKSEKAKTLSERWEGEVAEAGKNKLLLCPLSLSLMLRVVWVEQQLTWL